VERGISAPKELSAYLKAYANAVAQSPNLQQAGFIAIEPVSKELLIARLAGRTFQDAPDISALLDEFTSQRRSEQAQAIAGGGGAVIQEPVEPLTFNYLKQTRSKIGAMIKENAPMVVGNKKLYTMLYAALSEDKNLTVAAHRPDLAPVIGAAEATYKESVELLNSKIGIKIWNNRKSPSVIPNLILSNQQSLEDIGRMRDIVGEDAWQGIQAYAINTLLERSTTEGKWKPTGLRERMRAIGKPRLVSIFGRDTVETLQEIAEVSASFGRAEKIMEGSQTAFLLKATEIGGITLIGERLFSHDLQGAAAILSTLVGKDIWRRWIVTDAGQSWLLGRKGFIQKTGQAVQGAPAWPARAAFQTGRAGSTAQDQERKMRQVQQGGK
jgi:hypothetical protein